MGRISGRGAINALPRARCGAYGFAGRALRGTHGARERPAAESETTEGVKAAPTVEAKATGQAEWKALAAFIQ